MAHSHRTSGVSRQRFDAGSGAPEKGAQHACTRAHVVIGRVAELGYSTGRRHTTCSMARHRQCEADGHEPRPNGQHGRVEGVLLQVEGSLLQTLGSDGDAVTDYRGGEGDSSGVDC